MNDLDGTPSDASCSDDSRSSPSHSGRRRALLVAMPTILSLHQGVAAQVARSSSILVLAESPKRDDGNLLCAEDHGYVRSGKGWEIPSDATINITEIPKDATYCKLTDANPETYKTVKASKLCSTEPVRGKYYVAQPGIDCADGTAVGDSPTLKPITPRQGAWVSALAIASFGTQVVRTRIDL